MPARPGGRILTPRRGYSRAFTAPKTDRRHTLQFDWVPAELHADVKAKATREGVSLRALVLGWLKDWVLRETEQP